MIVCTKVRVDTPWLKFIPPPWLSFGIVVAARKAAAAANWASNLELSIRNAKYNDETQTKKRMHRLRLERSKKIPIRNEASGE